MEVKHDETDKQTIQQHTIPTIILKVVIFDVHVYGFHVHDHLMKYVRSSSGDFICTFWVLYHEGLPSGLTLA